MKRYLTTLALVALLAVAGTVFAAPSSVDRITNRIEPLIKTDFIRAVYFVATSTTASSTFANGLNITAGCFAVNNVCITAGGGGGSGVVNPGTQGQNAFYDSTGASVSGTSTIFISTASNVGIGTTTPSTNLHVAKSNGSFPALGTDTGFVVSNTSAAGSSAGMSIIGGTSGFSTLNFGDTADENVGYIQYGHTNNYMAFGTNTNEFLRILSSGNVGIGTSSPSGLLHVGAGTAGTNDTNVIIDSGSGSGAEPQIRFLRNSVLKGAVYVNSLTENLVFFNGGDRLVMTPAGRLGIGTTTPSAFAQITNISADPSFLVEDSSSVDSSPFIIDASGNVGVGTTTPYAKLAVVGPVAAQSFHATSTTATSTFQGNVLIDVTGDYPQGFNGTNPFVVNSNVAGPLQTQVVNPSTSAFATAGAYYAASNFENAGFFSKYYGGIAYAGPDFNTPGFDGLRPNGIAVFASDGWATFGSATTTAGIRLQAGGFGIDQVDLIIPGSTGNIGIGTTSPYAKLSVHPRATDTQRTLFAIASSTATATTTHMVVLNTGNVGIGTTTPAGKLTVDGLTTIRGGTNAQFRIGAFDGSGEAVLTTYNDSLSSLTPMRFYSSRYNFLSGNVSIGTTTNFGTLNVKDGTDKHILLGTLGALTTGMNVLHIDYDETSNYGYLQPRTANVAFRNFVLNPNGGSVGIGTTSPSGRFAVTYDTGAGDRREFYALNGRGLTSRYDDNTTANMRLQNFASIASSTFGSSIQFDLSAQVAGVVTQQNAGFISMIRTQDWSDTSTTNTSALAFATRNGASGVAERARISPAGNFGIATTSPQYNLTVGQSSGETSNNLGVVSNGFSTIFLRADENNNSATGDSTIRLFNDALFVGEFGIDASDSNTMKWFSGGTEGNFTGNGLSLTTAGFVGVATSTPAEEFSVGGIGSATSTAYFGSGTGKGSCMIMADTDGSGVTYVTANNGVLSASTVPCN